MVKLNGEPASEFVLNAYMAGYYKVPVAFLSGDQEICEQAKRMIPGIETVATPGGNRRCGSSPFIRLWR